MNGITLQAKVYGPHLPRTDQPRVEKDTQRSISIEHDELEVYIAGTRSGPKPLSTKDESG